ncbi:hypothetical protein LSH36_660g03008 [Paralvinella palmiformis]|uniref:Uncharacterized protein n=1 Tax=Paralvinella palmiformis TaxID=53620 RepID=A0AAD9J515_9ANNE|nr:hypothetical protein LSH36_660g03008 [Paralvinella palmiformis]
MCSSSELPPPNDTPFLSVRCVVLPSLKLLKYSAANLTKSDGLSRSTATVKSCSKSIKPGGISKFIVGLSVTVWIDHTKINETDKRDEMTTPTLWHVVFAIKSKAEFSKRQDRDHPPFTTTTQT